MNAPAGLREDLRALARKYGTVALVTAIADLVREFALRGVGAAIAERRADEVAAEQCPRCRRARAVLLETKERLKPPPPEGRLTPSGTDTSGGA